MPGLRRTPKVFGSSYQPPRSTTSRGHNLPWRPIIIVVCLVAVFSLIGRLPVFRLKSVEVEGDSSESVKAKLEELIGQSIFSSRVGRTINTLRTEIVVDSVNCRRGLPNSLRCTLVMKQPKAIWQSGDTTFFLDDRGMIFAAATTSDYGQLPVIEDTKHQPVRPGTVALSSEVIGAYNQLIDQLTARNLPVSRLLLDESFYQVTALVTPPGRSAVKILFLMTNDLSAQITAAQTVLSQKNESVTERIDVRVPGYVYVK